ncbi:MAG: UDP-glucose/GDP-mannose dehydrogenase family protein [Actinobacteria bacterium]|nr:UDP-glucose/GDP-mannose dehydrogenase family protein [Actinomycetota bacterium]
MATISVIGTGYLGATHAAAMAELNHDVIGIDVDADRIATLQQGRAPFYEPDLDDFLAAHTGSGRLRFSTDYAEAAEADIHFICVGTPQLDASGAADTSYVFESVEHLVPLLQRDSLIVGKSTVPVGTAQALEQRVRELQPDGVAVHVAWNPEFLREGFAVEDTLAPDRIVVGVSRETDAQTLRRLYAPQLEAGTPFIATDFATAELVKVAANSFLATKISYINAMAAVCDATGADVSALAEALGHDDRIGPKFLRAGVGFGGGCLPKDLRAFMARAGELGLGSTFTFLRNIDEINMRLRVHAVDRASELLGGELLGARVAALGVAFKPDSDDIRDSPALNIAAALHLRGAIVNVYDPKANDNARRSFPTLQYCRTKEDALDQADLVLLLTEWNEFLSMDPTVAKTLVAQANILDGRNALSPRQWREAGWHYQGIGIP